MKLPPDLSDHIAGYDVELMFTDDGGEDYVSHCHIIKQVHGQDGFGGSLESAVTGTLEDNEGNEMVITDTAVRRIREWAEENGY